MAELDRLLVRVEGDESNLQAALAKAQQDVTTASTRMQTALNGVGTSTRRLTPILQQAGFQVGDFAVQIAGGTPPLRAFIQQGSQMAGAFGPWGAVIGAAGAVLGVLITQMDLFGSSVDTAGMELGQYEARVKAAQSATEIYEIAIDASNDVLLTHKERVAAAADEQARYAANTLRSAVAAKIAERAMLQQRMQTEIQLRIDEARRQAAADPRAGLANIFLGQGTAVIDDIRTQIDAIDAAIKEAEDRLNRIMSGERGETGGGGASRRGKKAKEKLPDKLSFIPSLIEGYEHLREVIREDNEAATRRAEMAEAAALQELAGVKELKNEYEALGDVLDDLADGIAGLINGTSDWGDLLTGILQKLLDFKFEGGNLSGGIIDILGEAFGGIFSGGLDLFGGAGGGLSFGGLFAAGGRIGAREFGIVGERGPELIRGPAVVTPMSRAGMTVIIDARGADRVEFERVRRELRALNASVEERAVAANVDARRRGGSFARTFR